MKVVRLKPEWHLEPAPPNTNEDLGERSPQSLMIIDL
jgi:hypothetical protein